MRNTNLKDVLFPVDMQKVLREQSGSLGAPTSSVKVDGWRAVVDVERQNVLSVVTKKYRLVTNAEAFACGKVAFKQLFDSVNVEQDMVVFNVITPSTRSYCHVDLIHREYKLNLWKQEVYLPYLRVTNSYNRTKALHFDLGFVRKLCDNGVIFEATVRFKKPHTHHHLHESISFLAAGAQLEGLMRAFTTYMTDLNRVPVPVKLAHPLMARALGLSFEGVASNNAKRDVAARRLRDAFKARAGELLLRYYDEQGSNAYAVFNAATDFATNPPEEVQLRPGIHALQAHVGSWAEEFPAETRGAGFSLERYVEREVMQLAS